MPPLLLSPTGAGGVVGAWPGTAGARLPEDWPKPAAPPLLLLSPTGTAELALPSPAGTGLPVGWPPVLRPAAPPVSLEAAPRTAPALPGTELPSTAAPALPWVAALRTPLPAVSMPRACGGVGALMKNCALVAEAAPRAAPALPRTELPSTAAPALPGVTPLRKPLPAVWKPRAGGGVGASVTNGALVVSTELGEEVGTGDAPAGSHTTCGVLCVSRNEVAAVAFVFHAPTLLVSSCARKAHVCWGCVGLTHEQDVWKCLACARPRCLRAERELDGTCMLCIGMAVRLTGRGERCKGGKSPRACIELRFEAPCAQGTHPAKVLQQSSSPKIPCASDGPGGPGEARSAERVGRSHKQLLRK